MTGEPETDAGLLRSQLPAGSLRHFNLQETLDPDPRPGVHQQRTKGPSLRNLESGSLEIFPTLSNGQQLPSKNV